MEWGMTRILVVDDDRQLLRALRITLTARRYDVTVAVDGASGLAAASRSRPDLVILDLGLPDMDGVTVVEGIRGWSSVPIIVLSARHAEAAKVDALDAGADDYITKPFGMDEVLARIRAALRRAAPAPEAPVITTDAFTIDLATKRVTTPAGDVRLTPTEWHLLEVLARHPGRLVGHKQLLQEVWGPRYETETNYLRVHVANLRRKLEPDPAQPRYLITEPGVGYRFNP
jgi:two-component system KDP operon response regulator KdpE